MTPGGNDRLQGRQTKQTDPQKEGAKRRKMGNIYHLDNYHSIIAITPTMIRFQETQRVTTIFPQ
jgi:hypothetical protein